MIKSEDVIVHKLIVLKLSIFVVCTIILLVIKCNMHEMYIKMKIRIKLTRHLNFHFKWRL